MSTSEHDFEELLAPSEEEARMIRSNIARLEALQERIARRLAQLHLALGDTQRIAPSVRATKKDGARELIIRLLQSADKPLTRAEIIQRFRAKGVNYSPGTVHLYLKELYEGGKGPVKRGQAPAGSRSGFVYSWRKENA